MLYYLSSCLALCYLRRDASVAREASQRPRASDDGGAVFAGAAGHDPRAH